MADSDPHRKYVTMLTFSWGAAPTIQRYTSWTRDIAIPGGEFYASEPSIAVTPGTLDGGVEEKIWKVQMELRLPLTNLIRPSRFADVTCLIAEYDPFDGIMNSLYQGTIGVVTKNKKGQPKLCEFTVVGPKAKLKVPLGVIATNNCAWIFGRPPCCRDIVPLQQTETITGIVDDTVINFASLDVPLGGLARWAMGSAARDGLEITIQCALSQTSLLLAEVPPPEWDGAPVILTPGCDGALSTCRIYNNEHNFGGMGLCMPNHNPILGSNT